MGRQIEISHILVDEPFDEIEFRNIIDAKIKQNKSWREIILDGLGLRK